MDELKQDTNRMITRRRLRERAIGRLKAFGGWLKIVLCYSLLFLLAVAVTGVGAFSGKAFWLFLTQSPYFELAVVDSRGLSVELMEEVTEIAKIQPQSGRNLFLMNCDRMENIALRHPRLRNIAFEKDYPRRLIVKGEERETMAVLISKQGEAYALYEWGIVLGEVNLRTLERSYPIITGIPSQEISIGKQLRHGALDSALEMLVAMKKEDPDIFARVSEVQLDDEEGVLVYFKGGLTARFGPGSAVEKLPKLKYFFDQPGSENKEYVNLMYPNEIVFRGKETQGHDTE